MRALAALCLLGCGAQLGEAPNQAGGGAVTTASCGQLDVVFAIDNSGSMAKEQQALRDVAFPAFAEALVEDVGAEDFRVGVLDACNRPAAFHTRGITSECNFAGGHAWMESSSPALMNEFSCVANIDSRDDECNGNDDDEQPVATAAAALEPMWAAAGKPNAGFLRDDALLVVVAVTDEDEQPVPAASAQDLHDRLVALKGNAGNVVFLGAGGASDCEGPYGAADDADTLQEIANRFSSQQRGVFWDLCNGSLEQGMQQLAQTIERACGG